VDQTGENILFWIDHDGAEPHTEAHIQIQYQGDPERFAWLIPVSQVPEVKVGSQALFDNMLAGSVPTFTVNSRFEGDCAPISSAGCGLSVDFVSAGVDEIGLDTGAGGFDETGGGGVDILDRGFAGAFEYVTLTGSTVQEIVDWLDAAGYAQDEDAPPILQEYLDEGFVFVAIKLRSEAGVAEIHPLAIRYSGIEPCIPIRLTRIAAVDDMAIRAFFLGASRVAPQNWPHVELNALAIDWLNNPAASYLEQVSLAIDEAGGRAFVTEYAGSDEVVNLGGIRSTTWNAAAFAEIDPVDVFNVIRGQGLYFCQEDWDGTEVCAFTHPQVVPLLARYLPPPDNIDPLEFWENLVNYQGLIDPVAWGTQPGFAAEFEERITGPGDHALHMLGTSSDLTRLFTLISPHEMLEDPLFHEVEDLPDVSNNLTATQVFSCDDSTDYLEFSDYPPVALDDMSAWPDLGMPAARRIERVPAMGPPQVEVDNAGDIDSAVEDWNHSRVIGPTPWNTNCSAQRSGLNPESVLMLLAVFGIAGLQRRRRR
ncbi:MAG: DUF2330 domain-containing protein, partial [Myxococcales bacterium]|nr:DUF2330 domain-containing protein [Myxococcales bacterium]